MARYDFLLDTYRDLEHLLEAERRGGENPPLPGLGEKSPTERPDASTGS